MFALKNKTYKQFNSWNGLFTNLNFIPTLVKDVKQSHYSRSVKPSEFSKVLFFFHLFLEECVESETCVKLTKLLEVENALVTEYAGDIRSKINAIAGQV